MTLMRIKSSVFPDVYLRMNGQGVNRDSGAGGEVNCQYGAGPWELFDIRPADNNTVTIGSTVFPNIFLRLDGSGLTQYNPSGGGTVNCQFNASVYEKFRLVPQPDGTTAIASAHFNNVHLRIDGQTVKEHNPAGSGIVNAQFGAGPWEKFVLEDPAKQGLTEAELRLAIQTYGPVLRFHPQEVYNMCSIEAFLAHADLHDRNTGSVIRHPTVDQLPTSNEGQRYWLTLEDSFKGGDLSTARAYVHAFWKPGLSYTDLQFWFFYAYNGPGTLNVKGFALFPHPAQTSVDVDVRPVGEHYGDWECCMIRIDNASKRMIGAWLSQHSGGQTFNENQISQINLVNGQQPVVYASRDGHAVYAKTGPNYISDFNIVIEVSRVNATADGGNSLDCAKSYQIISADWLGAAFPEPRWVNYPYRWGPEGGETTQMSEDALRTILSAAIGDKFGGSIPMVAIAKKIADAFVKEDINGPYGPKTKDSWRGNY